MLRLIAPLLLAVALLASPAAAGECDDAATQADLTQCTARLYQKSDAELNARYKEIMQRLKGDEPAARALVAAQRAWIAFRDAECDFVSSGVAGGSIQPMIVAGCRDDLTRRRIEDLKRYLSCEEGDTSCPVPAP